MNGCRKKDILSIVTTMKKANDSVFRAIRTDPQGLTEMFIQCQDAALQIGTSLETMGEQYANIVSLLEDYCEDIYQMSISIPNEVLCHKLIKKVQKQLTDLYNHILYEMPDDRKEVVFLPYKASMWDSLESVWRAADQDPDCDAYVISVPYYDRNPDGSFGELHDERALYPKDVPVMGYEEYDFRERQPDMIFIHNPYDNYNYVTSVHPFFYAKNLKQYTRQLIYIPYFILGEVSPDNREAVKRMKHFCTLPGVLYADKVIVQSEDMRQIYIDVLTEEAGEETRSRWEEKILGLGSPKTDRVLKAGREEIQMPDGWESIIRKPDGSRKKVILYNTSVSALLRHGEKMLEKIRNVLQIFRENRDEVALLWRPHPLAEATIRSMRPELWEEYEELVEQYRAEGWGIYDDTPELDRAIALSDAYYGDWSSVVPLCRSVEMPVMIQNVEM